MGTWWTALLIALWVFVVAAGVLFLGILRQLGILHNRIDALDAKGVAPDGPEGLGLGIVAPDFRLSRVGGGELSPSSLRGTTALLAFIHPACGPCRTLLPQLNALVHRPSIVPFQVAIISSGTLEKAEQLQEEYELLPPLVAQEAKEVFQEYKVRRTPYVYAIDAQGIVCAHGIATTLEQLEQLLAFAKEGETHGDIAQEPLAFHGKEAVR